MPEKGWKIITVRDRIRVMLLDKSSKEGLSISDYLEELLRADTSRQKKQGSKTPKHPNNKVDKSTEALERAIQEVQRRKGVKA